MENSLSSTMRTAALINDPARHEKLKQQARLSGGLSSSEADSLLFSLISSAKGGANEENVKTFAPLDKAFGAAGLALVTSGLRSSFPQDTKGVKAEGLLNRVFAAASTSDFDPSQVGDVARRSASSAGVIGANINEFLALAGSVKYVSPELAAGGLKSLSSTLLAKGLGGSGIIGGIGAAEEQTGGAESAMLALLGKQGFAAYLKIKDAQENGKYETTLAAINAQQNGGNAIADTMRTFQFTPEINAGIIKNKSEALLQIADKPEAVEDLLRDALNNALKADATMSGGIGDRLSTTIGGTTRELFDIDPVPIAKRATNGSLLFPQAQDARVIELLEQIAKSKTELPNAPQKIENDEGL